VKSACVGVLSIIMSQQFAPVRVVCTWQHWPDPTQQYKRTERRKAACKTLLQH